jgi:hypothetical protein
MFPHLFATSSNTRNPIDRPPSRKLWPQTEHGTVSPNLLWQCLQQVQRKETQSHNVNRQIQCSKQVSVAARYAVLDGSIEVHQTFCMMYRRFNQKATCLLYIQMVAHDLKVSGLIWWHFLLLEYGNGSKLCLEDILLYRVRQGNPTFLSWH